MTETTIAGPSTAPERQLMPGCFNPGDYIDLYCNPFDVVADLTEQDPWQIRPKDRDTPWSRENLPELDPEGVDWFNYGPPAALIKAPNVTSDILHGLVNDSIEAVRAVAAEEKRRKEETAEEERKANAEQKKSGQGKEPYLPIVIPVEKPVEVPLPTPPPDSDISRTKTRPSDEFSLRRAEALRVASRSDSLSISSGKASSEKSSKITLRRILGRPNEKDSGKAEKKSRGAFVRKLLAGSDAPHANYVFSVYQPEAKGNSAVSKPSVEVKPMVAKPPTPEPVETVECVSCLDDFPLTNTVKAPCHNYCYDCFASLITVSVQNEQQWPPKCCLNEIPFRTVFKYVPEDLKTRFKDRSAEWKLPVDQRVYCHDAHCGLWIKPEGINVAEQVGRCGDRHKTCIMCRGKSHGSNPCQSDTNLSLTQQLAEEQGWKRCGKCKAYVEHATACRHITCRCGYQFCYVCGKRWCTCHCTGDQLAVIKEQAHNKSKERRLRDLAEAEELRNALAQIVEFEREEALKAELLRQEQERLERERERLERERQQRELEERVRKETVRRADLEAKFSELRKGLDLLHDLQVVMLESYQEDAANQLAEEIHGAKQKLDEQHQKERADVDTDIESKMKAKDELFGEEYQQRSAAEKQMIQDYKLQLEAFYSRHPKATQEINTALLPLLQRMDEHQQAYNKWKDAELERYQKKLRDRQQIKEEYRYSANARLQDAQDQKEIELVKKTVAETKWMQMVVLERERILGTMEADEMEGDADSLFGEFEIEEVGRAL